MADRENVFGHLSDCMEASRRDNTWVFVRKDIVADALALLKEQEHKDRMYHALEDDWKRLKELLKEQEAVEPIHYHRKEETKV